MISEMIAGQRLVIVSNRLPVILKKGHEGGWQVDLGSGGLVTAMAPVLRNRGGIWIGWPGSVETDESELNELLETATKDSGYTLRPVHLTAEERDGFYYGFSNEILWPLFHDFQQRANFVPEYWRTYEEANRRFAEVIVQNARSDDFIWVHDYHLMNVASELREIGVQSKIGFFLHIPFPPLDMFLKLPWRFQILHALLQYDIVGFQTQRDRRNFLQCVRTLHKGVTTRGKGQVITARTDSRDVRIGTFPIGIDFQAFESQARTIESSEHAWYLHEDLSNQHIILGVDRLDYTKGIPERLEAFRRMLKRHPELHGNVTLVQVVVPSREDIPMYSDMKTELDQLIGRINGEFTTSGWVPIHYLFRSLKLSELVAYYRTAEVALVTPLKDGMNLVAKEYCACSIEEKGTLILSEFAGAAAQLQRGALMVNPYDVEGVAKAIHQAILMEPEEQRRRMKTLRQVARRQNIFWWVDSYLRAAIAKDLHHFPHTDDFVPEPREEDPSKE